MAAWMNEAIRAKLQRDLVRDEGQRTDAYKDSVGLWTIGVGHLLGSTQRMTTITIHESMALLDADIDTAAQLAARTFDNFATLGEGRQRALVNMCFNLGGRINGFVKFISAVEAEQWERAAAEMTASKWFTQVGERAVRLRNAILTGRER